MSVFEYVKMVIIVFFVSYGSLGGFFVISLCVKAVNQVLYEFNESIYGMCMFGVVRGMFEKRWRCGVYGW